MGKEARLHQQPHGSAASHGRRAASNRPRSAFLRTVGTWGTRRQPQGLMETWAHDALWMLYVLSCLQRGAWQCGPQTSHPSQAGDRLLHEAATHHPSRQEGAANVRAALSIILLPMMSSSPSWESSGWMTGWSSWRPTMTRLVLHLASAGEDRMLWYLIPKQRTGAAAE